MGMEWTAKGEKRTPAMIEGIEDHVWT